MCLDDVTDPMRFRYPEELQSADVHRTVAAPTAPSGWHAGLPLLLTAALGLVGVGD